MIYIKTANKRIENAPIQCANQACQNGIQAGTHLLSRFVVPLLAPH